MENTEQYKCEDCGLHYEDEKLAQECYEFYAQNKACSVEMTKHSTEHKKLVVDRQKAQG